ncbi:MAG: 3-oxoacyl-[acyl-carrier-protein] synthase 2 [Planctomycetota bacterium]|nr:MAG: 3-oxoacyl-[acyl-carrier-protein] synthase 2 [Planctomycetota bacterium]
MSERQRVVVTGLGAVTPLGPDLASSWERALAGESGVRPIEHFDASSFPTRIAGYCREFDVERWLDRKTARHTDRFVHLTVAAADMALADAGLEPARLERRERAGAVLASGIGGLDEILEQTRRYLERGVSRLSPFFVPKMMANAAAGMVAIRHGLAGPNFATVSACAASSHAVGTALLLLRAGMADVMLAGGGEAAVNELGVGAFCAARALSTRNEEPARASRPFDRGRDGFVIGEGAGVVVLETLEHARARGARIYAELAGFGATDDCHHMTAPDPEARGAAAAMRAALADAGLSAEDVGYINAHGTSTPLGDVAETRAIKEVFGQHAYRLAVSATKSQIGHLLGAAGAVGLIFTLKAMQTGVLPPTINLEEPDPECDLDYVPNRPRECAVRAALVNAFGFGGHNASLAVRALGAAEQQR